MLLDLALRLLHIVPALFLGGGILFMWSALIPALGSVSDEARASVSDAVRGKWAKIVMACSGILVITGLINAVRNILAFEYTAAPYHLFVTVKLVLAIAIMFISARLSGRSESAAKFREKISFWMSVNTALLLVLVLIASTMKVSPRIPKVADSDSEAVPTINVEVEADPAP